MPIPLLARIEEARRRPTVSPSRADAAVAGRRGFVPGIPLGGATETNPGQAVTGGVIDRPTFMSQLMQAYLACTWVSASVDVIARTATAGGVQCVPNAHTPDRDVTPSLPKPVQEVQELLEYVNPYDDIRQLMRGVMTDLLIFGDSFTEIVFLMGKPVALYSLDPATITILADEHGNIQGYEQQMETGRKVIFKPWEIIHVKYDAPGSGLYGISPTQKNLLAITTWLFTEALVKETMKRGDPLRAHVDWPIALPEAEMKRLQQQYAIRNIGARNIGNLFETKGGALVKELGVNQIERWLLTLNQLRDAILSGFGVPPSKAGVIEAGNIGGGTGTAQDRTFNVNTVGPLQEMVMEKFSFALLYQAYGVEDWHMQFGQVDWRDDIVLEQIADMRIKNGRWTANRARAVIGEAPIEGGDDAVLVERQNLTLWADLGKLSSANVAAVQAEATAKTAKSAPGSPSTPSAPKAPAASEADEDEGIVEMSLKTRTEWIAYENRRLRVLRELAESDSTHSATR